MFKTAPESFKGMVGDVAEMLRITLTGRKNSPNLYYVMKILGKENSSKRIKKVISFLKVREQEVIKLTVLIYYLF